MATKKKNTYAEKLRRRKSGIPNRRSPLKLTTHKTMREDHFGELNAAGLTIEEYHRTKTRRY